jgi:uncharacterized RDD family membrane protein YckC
MNDTQRKAPTDYSNDDLLSLAKNPYSLPRKKLIDIYDELKKRGYTEQVEEFERRLSAKPIYSTFWARFGAYFLDGMILGLVGMLLGFLMNDFFSQMGSQGLLVGFLISLLYFGLGNSKVFNGQTLGKKALQLQVVDRNFNTLLVPKSILRALIYTIPFFFLNYRIAGWSELSLSFIVKGVIFITFLIVLPIHLILNTPTRQALHDLFAGTYVINLNGYSRQLSKSRFLPILISGFLAIVIIAFIVFLNVRKKDSKILLKELGSITEQIDKFTNVSHSSLSSITSSTKRLGSDSISKSTSLGITIVLKKDLISNLSTTDMENLNIVKDAVKLIINNYSEINNLDVIQVSLLYGYNIGIARSSRSLTTFHSIDNWKKKIE